MTRHDEPADHPLVPPETALSGAEHEACPRQELPPRARRRWPRPLLLVGLVLILLPLLPELPRDRPVRVHLTDPATLTRLELLWLAPDGREALGQSVWSFAPGTAPTALPARVSAPSGLVRLRVRVQRGQRQQTLERRVEFGWAAARTEITIE